MESEFKNVNLARGLENVLDNYLINKFGKVIRTSLNYIDRLGREISKEDKEISPHSDICGFNRVYLHTKDNKRINVPCSYIVASLFVDNPNNYTSIEYKNLDKSDYKYSNLEWVKAFDNPKYDEFKPRTIWSLQNTTNEVFKKVKSPLLRLDAMEIFNETIDKFC